MKHWPWFFMFSAFFGSAAYAQTATLFGAIDAGIEFMHTGSGPKAGTTVRESGNNLYGSRLGIMGKEKLNGDLSVVYRLEMGFLAQNGNLTLGNRTFGRQASLGLKTRHDQLLLGRLLSPLLNGVNKFDPAIYANYALNSQDPGLVARGDNAIRYTRFQGPFEFDIFYSLGVDTVSPTIGGASGSAAKAKDIALSFGYDDRRHFAVNFVYDRTHGPLTTATYGIGYVAPSLLPKVSVAGDRATRYVVEGKYRFAGTALFAGWRHLDADVSGRRYNSNLYWTGVRHRFSPRITGVGAVYHQNVAGVDARPTSIVVEGIYKLSKTTFLYSCASYVMNTRLSAVGADVNQPTSPGANQTGIQIGMTHFF